MNVWEKATVQNLQVNEDIIATKFFSSNATSKSLIQFQTNLRQSQLYYYNLDVEKYYKTGQNIHGKDYKSFNLTSWAEDGFQLLINVLFLLRQKVQELNILCFMTIGADIYQTATKQDGNEIIM